jgi:hypothetical protein
MHNPALAGDEICIWVRRADTVDGLQEAERYCVLSHPLSFNRLIFRE